MRPGDVVAERFEVLREAGAGGMGVVYQARDRVSGATVALKVLIDLRPGEARHAQGDRFLQESELLSTLDHPHIVGYVAHGTTGDGAPYLVMPWLEGRDLQTRLREGPLSIDDTLLLARRVADGLAHLHGKGLIHRDLKPSNLFLPHGRLDDVQVIDLGIARAAAATQALTLSGVLLGTPGYIAPEQALDHGTVTPALDVFAFGCVLFECLTGRRLFDGAHVMAVLAKVLVQDAPRPSELRAGVPPPLDRLVQSMVAKDPSRRPRDGVEVRRQLDELGIAPCGATSRPPSSITGREQRVVSVLVVVLPADAPAATLSTLAHRFGVRMTALDGRTAVVLAPDGLGADDQAVILARFGSSVAHAFPGASVALATGSAAMTGALLPVGEAIDRGVTIVRTATPGQGVLVDDLTAGLITSRFDVRREIDRLVLADERLSLDPTRTLLGRPTSCVGRDREIAMLEALYAECIEARAPRVVLVTAAAGSGKSRLRHELQRRLAASSAAPRVLLCRGDPLHLATPYAQIAHGIRHVVGAGDPDRAAPTQEKLRAHVAEHVAPGDVDRVAAFLGELVGAPFDDASHVLLRAARKSPEAMADHIRLAFADLMRGWCAQAPALLVLEDLHWADPASVALVDDALRRLAGAPFFVLALARAEAHERFPELWSRRHPTEIRLPPLPSRASTRLVREIMGDDVGLDDVARIVARSEGNAFYLEELIREAAERRRRRSQPPGVLRADVPETVVAMAQARLERLEPVARKVLRAASVFGEVFPLEGVSVVVGEPPSALEPTLAALVGSEALASSETGEGRTTRELVFRHAFLRVAAYAALTEDDRTLGHRLAAAWLEEHGEDREVVALHWLEGGERARAAASFAGAATAWRARMHPHAAARCAARSLLVCAPRETSAGALVDWVTLLADALEAARWIDAGDVLAGLAPHVALDAGGAGPAGSAAPPESMDARTVVRFALRRALDALRAAGAAAAVATARAAKALGAIGDLSGAKALLAEAADRLGAEPDAHGTVSHAAAKVAFLGGEHGAAVSILSSTVLPDDAREYVDVLLMLASETVAVAGREALGRGLDCVARAEGRLASLGDDPVPRVRCAKARLACFYYAGLHGQAAEVAQAVATLARQAGLRYDECAHLHNAGEQYLRLGDAARARTLLCASHALACDVGADGVRLNDEALLAYLDGDATRLDALARDFEAAGDAWHELHVRYWLGRHLTGNDTTGARLQLERALAIARALEVRLFLDDCTCALDALA